MAYTPQKFNKTYKRASTPALTMFYGWLPGRKLLNSKLDGKYIVSNIEAPNLLRDQMADGIQIVTISKWSVKKDFEVIT